MTAKQESTAKAYVPTPTPTKALKWETVEDAKDYFDDRAADVGTLQQAKAAKIIKAAAQAKAQFGLEVNVSNLI